MSVVGTALLPLCGTVVTCDAFLQVCLAGYWKSGMVPILQWKGGKHKRDGHSILLLLLNFKYSLFIIILEAAQASDEVHST